MGCSARFLLPRPCGTSASPPAAAAAAGGGGGGGPLPGLAAWALVRVGMSAKHLIITTNI